MTTTLRANPNHTRSLALLASVLVWFLPLLSFAQELPLVTAKDLEGPFSLLGNGASRKVMISSGPTRASTIPSGAW